MAFKETRFSELNLVENLPEDIELIAPQDSRLPVEQRHFLLSIPWKETYLNSVPEEYRAFFQYILPYLHARTTDVHTAISSGYLDTLLSRIAKPVNRRVVAFALFLHDSGWSRLTEEEIANSLGVKGLKLNEKALGPKEKHALESEKIAREVLQSQTFFPDLSPSEVDLICKAILFHDKPEAVAGAENPMPLEVQVLVDLDHLWSFTHENFWQDVVRKGVNPPEYLRNLGNDLDSYFVTPEGKQLARELLSQRAVEVSKWRNG